MRAANPVKEVRHIGLMGEELVAFLNTLKAVHPGQFQAVEKALRIDPLAAWGPVAEWGTPGRAEGIPQALDDEDQATSTSERILRGDFDE